MLRNIQKKIVLIFLVIGAIIIGTIGYINYAQVQKISVKNNGDTQNYQVAIDKYKEQLKITTGCGMAFFALASIIIRNICN